jgi:hypothetical protein
VLLRPKKPRFPRPTPSNGPINGFNPIKIIHSQLDIKKKRYIGNFMFMSFSILYLICEVGYGIL